MTVVKDKNQFLRKNDDTMHLIRVDPDDPDAVIEVWVRDITFLDIQAAAQKMLTNDGGQVGLSLEGYWNHAFSNWVTKSNPHLSEDDLLNLNAYVGDNLSKVLPQPNDIAEALQGGFTNAAE